MLIANQMRFGSDVFGDPVQSGGDSSAPVVYAVTKDALLIAKQPLDCSAVTHVDNFVFAGSQPAATSRRLVFQIDDALFKFVDGVLTAYTGAGHFNDVIQNGNTVAELAALDNITGFVGKQVFPIIALSAPEDADPPRIKLWLKTRTVDETTTKRVFSAAFDLDGSDVKIVSVTAAVVTSGQGAVEVKCRLHHDGLWGSWLLLPDAANLPADKIQFVFKFSVVNIGEDSAQVESVTVTHTDGAGAVNGNIAELFSVTADFQVPLTNASVVVRHKRLIDSVVDAAVSFRPKPLHQERLSLGVADGSRQVFNLTGQQLDHSTLKVFLDGEPSDDFDYDCSAGTLTLTAPDGTAVAASYDYNCGVEQWLPMTRQGDQQPYGDDSFASRFTLNAPTNDDCSRVAVRLTLNKTTGHISRQALGKATGYRQDFVLPHHMTSLVVTKPADWSYDPDNQLLTLVAPADTNLAYAGNWSGESLALFSFAAGFAL